MSIAELAASIKECGVLQNLVVVQGARGRYEVCAGGRRLDALTLLVATATSPTTTRARADRAGRPGANRQPCRRTVFHIPMHPADEFAAFAKLIGQGKSVEDVAAAFGVTPLVVAPHEARHRLAQADGRFFAKTRSVGLPDGAGLGG